MPTLQRQQESAFENLVWPLSLHYDWQKVILSMFGTAFDASGHESDQPLLVVAGFVAPASVWEEFSDDWKDRLARDGLEYFRLNEFISWNAEESVKRSLLADLMNIIRCNASRKFGICVHLKGFSSLISKEAKDEWRMNAYVLGGMECMTRADWWAASEKIQAPLLHTFEEGDVGTGRLSDLAIRCQLLAPRFAPGKKDRLHPITSEVIPAFVPLQAADWLAGEYFLENKRKLQNVPKRSESRWPYTQFDDMPGKIIVADDSKLNDIEAGFKIALASRNIKP